MAAAFGRFPNIPYTDRNGAVAQRATGARPRAEWVNSTRSSPSRAALRTGAKQKKAVFWLDGCAHGKVGRLPSRWRQMRPRPTQVMCASGRRVTLVTAVRTQSCYSNQPEQSESMLGSQLS
jgi:hypothetical protein